jgi:hypothetical protein
LFLKKTEKRNKRKKVVMVSGSSILPPLQIKKIINKKIKGETKMLTQTQKKELFYAIKEKYYNDSCLFFIKLAEAATNSAVKDICKKAEYTIENNGEYLHMEKQIVEKNITDKQFWYIVFNTNPDTIMDIVEETEGAEPLFEEDYLDDIY